MPDTAVKLPVQSGGREGATRTPTRSWPFLNDLRRDMESLFDDVSHGWFQIPTRERRMSRTAPWSGNGDAMPAVDVTENGKAFRLTAELPGLDQKAIDIRVAGDVLTIRGEKSVESEEKGENVYLCERHYGAFERAFALPANVDVSKIEATFAKGVLTVTLPKRPEAQVEEKKISVKAA